MKTTKRTNNKIECATPAQALRLVAMGVICQAIRDTLHPPKRRSFGMQISSTYFLLNLKNSVYFDVLGLGENEYKKILECAGLL